MHHQAAGWIAALLEARNIPYQVCGGLAAQGYGAKRDLNDIDLFVPAEHFSAVVDAGVEFISKPAKHYCEEGWDLTYVQFKYEGVKIEVGSAEETKVYDAENQCWVPLDINFAEYETVELLGQLLPLMPKKHLVRYKALLARPVDLDDIHAINGVC